MTYSVDVITADTSTLKSRAVAHAFTQSPYLVTSFAGPTAAQRFYTAARWRWAFGGFAIILPVVATPLVVILKINQNLARRQDRDYALNGGESNKLSNRGRLLFPKIWHKIIEFDGKCLNSLRPESPVSKQDLVYNGFILILIPPSISLWCRFSYYWIGAFSSAFRFGRLVLAAMGLCPYHCHASFGRDAVGCLQSH